MTSKITKKDGTITVKGKDGKITDNISTKGKKAPTARKNLEAVKKTSPKKAREGYKLYGSGEVELLVHAPFVYPDPALGLEPEEIFNLWFKTLDKIGREGMDAYDKIDNKTPEGQKAYKELTEARRERYSEWHNANPMPEQHSPEREARIRDHATEERKKERFAEIVGATVTGIWFSDDLLTFETDEGLYSYYLDDFGGGFSYFADFHGVKNLYENGAVISIEEIQLQSGDPGYLPPDSPGPRHKEDSVEVYGVRLTTLHPHFEEVSSTFSFRNESNGYYGSEIFRYRDNGQGKESEKKWLDHITPNQVRLAEDKVGD